jgi:hypothetical protein
MADGLFDKVFPSWARGVGQAVQRKLLEAVDGEHGLRSRTVRTPEGEVSLRTRDARPLFKKSGTQEPEPTSAPGTLCFQHSPHLTIRTPYAFSIPARTWRADECLPILGTPARFSMDNVVDIWQHDASLPSSSQPSLSTLAPGIVTFEGFTFCPIRPHGMSAGAISLVSASLVDGQVCVGPYLHGELYATWTIARDSKNREVLKNGRMFVAGHERPLPGWTHFDTDARYIFPFVNSDCVVVKLSGADPSDGSARNYALCPRVGSNRDLLYDPLAGITATDGDIPYVCEDGMRYRLVVWVTGLGAATPDGVAVRGTLTVQSVPLGAWARSPAPTIANIYSCPFDIVVRGSPTSERVRIVEIARSPSQRKQVVFCSQQSIHDTWVSRARLRGIIEGAVEFVCAGGSRTEHPYVASSRAIPQDMLYEHHITGTPSTSIRSAFTVNLDPPAHTFSTRAISRENQCAPDVWEFTADLFTESRQTQEIVPTNVATGNRQVEVDARAFLLEYGADEELHCIRGKYVSEYWREADAGTVSGNLVREVSIIKRTQRHPGTYAVISHTEDVVSQTPVVITKLPSFEGLYYRKTLTILDFNAELFSWELPLSALVSKQDGYVSTEQYEPLYNEYGHIQVPTSHHVPIPARDDETRELGLDYRFLPLANNLLRLNAHFIHPDIGSGTRCVTVACDGRIVEDTVEPDSYSIYDAPWRCYDPVSRQILTEPNHVWI